MAKTATDKTKPNVGRPKKTMLKAKVAKGATGKVKKAIKTAQNTSDVLDTSLSPVVIKKSKQTLQNDSVEATKPTGRLSRSAKTDNAPQQLTKSVEQVLDIREIKKQAQKIIQEKQNKALGAKLRVSPRKKENINTPLSSHATQNRRNKDNARLIETISDGPTISLLSQNKLIQKNLPKPLRHVQKQLLKETKSKKMAKKSALLKKNDVKNQKIIQKLTKVLLKNKVLTKAQLNGLVQNKSDFKAIAALVGLLKAKRKSTTDDKKNKWRVCSKEEEDEEEEEKE
uniref:Uncharacterized protein n=1 Tax=Cacopsylla melanoneura TaxID=428564 RepID=A0A8D8SPG2_9HEMI